MLLRVIGAAALKSIIESNLYFIQNGRVLEHLCPDLDRNFRTIAEDPAITQVFVIKFIFRLFKFT